MNQTNKRSTHLWKKALSTLLAICMLGALLPIAASASTSMMTEEDWALNAKMVAMKTEYPEGRPWTNDDRYEWHNRYSEGGITYSTYTGFGCAGFAMILSDAAFGTTGMAYKVTNFTYADVGVGDILRLPGHSVIVLEKYSDHVVIAEGNYNQSIHWGRTIAYGQVVGADYIIQRDSDTATTPTPAPTQITQAMFTVDTAKETYDGTAKTKTIQSSLIKDTDYTVSYSNNVNAGTATITITGIGDYTGTLTYYFTIEAQSTPTSPAFTDVKQGEYYYDAVLWAVENSITSGTSATTFSPSNSCTRAEAVTFLWRAAGQPAPSGGGTYMPFSDVPAGSYYYDAVLWALEKSITSGTSATTFSPDTVCNRAEIATFLYRGAGSPAVSGSGSFYDVPTTAFYYNATIWASREGITSGTSATTFSPLDSCTRGQIVTFLYRSATGA